MRGQTITGRLSVAVATMAVLLVVQSGVADAASVENGSFETGDFTGWERDAQPDSAGAWEVYTGTSTPFSDHEIPDASCGTYATVADTVGETSNVLHQAIDLEADQTHTLTLQYFYENVEGDESAGFFTPDTLELPDDPGDPENQQFRIDIMDGDTADPFSVGAEDVLDMAFRTEVGDPNSSGGWQDLEIDLTPWAGQTVYLRTAVVMSAGYLHAGIDCVEVASQPLQATTTTTTTTTTTAPPAAAAPVTAAAPTFTG